MNKPEVLICECGSLEHTIGFWYDEDKEGWDDLFIYARLKPKRGFFKRLWLGIKYAFGYTSRYGEYGEFIVDKNDCDKLIGILQKYKNAKK